MVEAVTSRVSVLPVVGSDLLTGLSVAAGGTDQLFLDSGDVLDKVGHGAGRSGARMVPVERLLKLREACDIMFSWMRPVAVLTSQFFLSEEGEDVVCWSLTSLCHSNGHIETMPAREINPFTALTRIRSQFLRTQ